MLEMSLDQVNPLSDSDGETAMADCLATMVDPAEML
jgi:hypothetical protein